MTFFYTFENLTNSLANSKLSIWIRTFLRCGVKLQWVRDIAFVFNLTEDHLQKFKERRLLLHTIIYVNVVVASFENKQQVIVRCIPKAGTGRPVDIVQITVSGWNIIILHELDISISVNILAEYIFLNTVRPHTPLTIGTNRHIGLQLCNAILGISRIYGLLFTLNDQFDGTLSLFFGIFFPNNYVGTRLIGTDL